MLTRVKMIASVIVASLTALGIPAYATSSLRCSDPDAQRLVVWVTLSDAMQKLSVDPFGGLALAFNAVVFGIDMEAFVLPVDQVDGVLERECQEPAQTDQEKRFCNIVRSVSLGFIRTKDINPRTGNLDCAATFIGPDGKRGGEVEYKIEATSDGGFFVTVID